MAQLTEYLSKMLLARYGLPLEEYRLATSADEAVAAAVEFGHPVMIKALVPVGGRGKAGAIRCASAPAEAAAAFRVVTQVRFGDLQALQVLVEPWQRCAVEYYLAVMVDPESAGPVVLLSTSGGVDIESTGAALRIPLRKDYTLSAATFRRLAYGMDVSPRIVERLISTAQALVRAFIALDARLVEVNPLGVMETGDLLALDARVIVDDHALYRQPELRRLIAEMRPRPHEDLVRDSTRLEYVRLGGWLGLISGGAGMTMAVMDLIADLGGEPACFLDCSANPTLAGYGAALDLMLNDPNVLAILVSIFGGLTHVERVARTLVQIFAERAPHKPITIRLMGTNVEEAEAVLAAAGLANHRGLEDAVGAAIASVHHRSESGKVTIWAS